MRKTTRGNCDIRFYRSARDASSSSKSILQYPSVFRCSDYPYQDKCLLPLSELIGPFKLIFSSPLICLGSPWEILLPLIQKLAYPSWLSNISWYLQEILLHSRDLISYLEMISNFSQSGQELLHLRALWLDCSKLIVPSSKFSLRASLILSNPIDTVYWRSC